MILKWCTIKTSLRMQSCPEPASVGREPIDSLKNCYNIQDQIRGNKRSSTKTSVRPDPSAGPDPT